MLPRLNICRRFSKHWQILSSTRLSWEECTIKSIYRLLFAESLWSQMVLMDVDSTWGRNAGKVRLEFSSEVLNSIFNWKIGFIRTIQWWLFIRFDILKHVGVLVISVKYPEHAHRTDIGFIWQKFGAEAFLGLEYFSSRWYHISLLSKQLTIIPRLMSCEVPWFCFEFESLEAFSLFESW